MSFFLHIGTEELKRTAALDTLKVEIRKPSNALLETLATFSNLQARRGFQLHTYDLTPFKGQTVKFCLRAREDAGSVTSFVADDFSFAVK
jgi:xanthomonalisin